MYFPLLVGLGCRSSWVFCGGNLRESYMLETLRSRILTFPANHKLREVTWPVPCRQVCGLMFTFVRLDHALELIHQRYHPRILSHQDTQTGSMVGRPNLDYLTGFHNGDGIQQTRRKSRYLKKIRLHLTNWAKLNKGENANSFFLVTFHYRRRQGVLATKYCKWNTLESLHSASNASCLSFLLSCTNVQKQKRDKNT